MNILKVARAKLGISQKDMADKLGMSRQQIINYESNKQKPSLERLFKVAEAYKLTNEEVLNHFEKGEEK